MMDAMPSHAIVVEVQEDAAGVRRLFVRGAWPPVTMFADQFLEEAAPDLVTVEGDLVTICVQNGRAVYRLLRRQRDETLMHTPAELVQATLDGDTQSS